MANEKPTRSSEKESRLRLIAELSKKVKPVSVRKPLKPKSTVAVSVQTSGNVKRGYRTEVYVDHPELLSAYGLNVNVRLGGQYSQQ